MTVQERINAQSRIEVLEKEMAALKLQLEGRPTHVRVPLKVFNFENPKLRDLDKLDDAAMHEMVAQLENHIEETMIITISWY